MDSEHGASFFTRYSDYIVPAILPLVVLAITIMAWVLGTYTAAPDWVVDVVAIAAILLGGSLRFRAAVRDVVRRKITVNVFVTLAIAASVLIGQFIPAAVIVFIMSAAGGLESFTVRKTRMAIESLLDLTPKVATIRRDGEEIRVDIGDVKTGDVVVVRTGERIPVDGVVIDGEAAVNEAPITGESMPVDKTAGDEVFGGTLSDVGHLLVRTTRVGDDATLARVVHLVEKAQSAKAPIALIADRFTAYFLPAVLFIAIATYFVSGELVRAVSILLVACPCALAIATPSAVTAGIANLARRGVLVKGGVFFEIAGKLRTLVFDKTGTTTIGRPQVTDIVALDGQSTSQVLALAASAETLSEHPIGRAIVERAHDEKLRPAEPTKHKVQVGHGVAATVNGARVVVGNRRMLSRNGIDLQGEADRVLTELEGAGKTALVVASEGRPVGVIAVADTVRADVPRVVEDLRRIGIEEVLLFTGDNEQIAADVAHRIGADRWEAGLLPEAKQAAVATLRAEGRLVGMVGDGVNDAPSLAEADVGFAMGTAGSDIAIETADVSLMADDLSKVVDTIRLSRKVSRRIKINIALSMIYNAVGIYLSARGSLNPVPAVLYQELGCLSVILSSTLLLWAR